MNHYHNIAVTRLQNIGDMLVFVPALRKLRECYPAARITLIGKHKQGMEVVGNCPYVDEILEIGSGIKSKLRAILEFRKRKFDLFIVSPQDQGKVPWAWLGGAGKIAAFPKVLSRDVWKFEKWTWGIDFAPEFDAAKTETENSLRLIAAAAGFEPVFSKQDLYSEYSWFRNPEQIREKLSGLGIDFSKKLVLSALVSKEPCRNWPPERFRALFDRFAERNDIQLVLLGGPKDADLAEPLVCPPRVISTAGKLTLDESAWLLKQGSLFVGNNSGPAHLASAVGCPVVVFYLKTDFARWSVPAARNIRRELVCADNDIRELSLDTVRDACFELLKPVKK